MSTLSPFIQLCIAATATRKINKSQSNLKERSKATYYQSYGYVCRRP